MDGYYRGGKMLDHKASAEIAIETSRARKDTRLRRCWCGGGRPGKSATSSPFVKGRDFWVDEILPKYRGTDRAAGFGGGGASAVFDVHERQHGEAEGMPASHGRVSRVRDGDIKYIQDLQPEDVYWCMADIGWITGHSYIVYGPLALGGDERDL